MRIIQMLGCVGVADLESMVHRPTSATMLLVAASVLAVLEIFTAGKDIYENGI